MRIIPVVIIELFMSSSEVKELLTGTKSNS